MQELESQSENIINDVNHPWYKIKNIQTREKKKKKSHLIIFIIIGSTDHDF